MVDPGFAAGAYAPARIALMPPDVFVVVDQVGDNDPAQSAALGQAVSAETVRAVEQALRARGYDVDLSARWDGIFARDGSLLIGRDELGAVANSVLQFANSPAGGGDGPMTVPRYVAPELAARVGWATQSDAFLYVNVKGVTVTAGKRAASVLAAVFIVAIIAVIILALVAQSKGGGGGGGGGNASGGGGGWKGQPVARAPSPSVGGSAWHGTPPVGGGGAVRPPVAAGGWKGGGAAAPPPGGGGWRGGGGAPPPGAVVYGGPRVSVGVGVIVPLDEPVYTHDGSVGYDDPLFAGDEIYVSMTLVSTYDGRILWHARDHLDLEAEQPQDIDRMVQTFVGSLPPRYAPPPAPRR
jgi:hypothetical protein